MLFFKSASFITFHSSQSFVLTVNPHICIFSFTPQKCSLIYVELKVRTVFYLSRNIVFGSCDCNSDIHFQKIFVCQNLCSKSTEMELMHFDTSALAGTANAGMPVLCIWQC